MYHFNLTDPLLNTAEAPRVMPLSMHTPFFEAQVLSPEQCLMPAAYCMDNAATDKLRASAVFKIEPDGSKSTSYNSSVRNSMGADIVPELFNPVYAAMDRAVQSALPLFGIPAQQQLRNAGDQCLVYKQGGFFKQHADDSIVNMMNGPARWDKNQAHRQLTCLLYLNDQGSSWGEFLGGEFEFNRLRTEDERRVIFQPRAGLMLLFPSNPWFTHEVHPILSGHRICVTRWYTAWTE